MPLSAAPICALQLFECSCECFKVSPEEVYLLLLIIHVKTPAASVVFDISSQLRQKLSNKCHRHRLQSGLKRFTSTNVPPELSLDSFGRVTLSQKIQNSEKKVFDVTLFAKQDIEENRLDVCNCWMENSVFNIKIDVSFTGKDYAFFYFGILTSDF